MMILGFASRQGNVLLRLVGAAADPGRLAMDQSIGIVSPIQFSNNQELETNFKSGVSDAGATVSYFVSDSIGYDPDHLAQAVEDLDGTVGLIVTVGGNASAMAAQ